jgi:hypothetical protein
MALSIWLFASLLFRRRQFIEILEAQYFLGANLELYSPMDKSRKFLIERDPAAPFVYHAKRGDGKHFATFQKNHENCAMRMDEQISAGSGTISFVERHGPTRWKGLKKHENSEIEWDAYDNGSGELLFQIHSRSGVHEVTKPSGTKILIRPASISLTSIECQSAQYRWIYSAWDQSVATWLEESPTLMIDLAVIFCCQYLGSSKL